jgi:UDP-2-acetamido-2,6-beta-L-arabino-hexul-4-ose reductase
MEATVEHSDSFSWDARLPAFVRAIPLDTWQDERGAVVIPATEEDLRNGRVLNLHTVSCRPGTVRGNHFHPNATERICVLRGNFVAHFASPRDREFFQVEIPDGHAVLLEIESGIAHAFENVGRSDGLLLCYADKAFGEVQVKQFALVASDEADR